MKPIKKLLQELSDQDSSRWLEEARYRRDNRNWLKKSKRIALKILTQLDNLQITKVDLAERSGIPIEQINDIVKGNQDLTLSTITTLEEVLGIILTDCLTKVEDEPPKESEIIKIEPEYYREGSFRERKERFKWGSWKKLYDGFRRKV